MTKDSLTIFFPAHNEAGNIAATIQNALEAAEKHFDDFEVIVINDGSTDNTAEITTQISSRDPRVRLVNHANNLGYGAALKTGFRSAAKELVFFTDGDGQFDIREISNLLPLISTADIAAGFRIKRNDPWHRLLYGKLFGWSIGLIFGLWHRDIDCAFKLIKKSVLDSIELKADGAMISTELLIKAKKAGFLIKQVGVHHYPRKAGCSSGGNPKVILKAAAEIFKLWKDLH